MLREVPMRMFSSLGADHLTLEGGGGWVILKKNFL